MRTSRISKDTARVIAALSTPARETRSRVAAQTNGSLGRFAHSSADGKGHGSDSDASELSDEDVSRTEESDVGSRKRKRVASSAGGKGKAVKVEKSTSTTVKSEEFKPSAASPQKTRRQPAKIKRSKEGEVLSATPPTNWEEVYEKTRVMRLANPAVVDTMGCERLSDRTMSAEDQRLQTLIALMLSSQTKDTTTAAAIKTLQEGMQPGGLTLQNLLDVEPEKLNQMIGKVGFHNVKTKNIKRVATILRDDFAGDIPDTIEGLTSLPGVGPKMGYLCLSAAWGRTEGIGVDVHVHRITNLWGWHKTKNPEETRMTLQSWLPREKWHEINWLLVGFGQTICPPVGRKCERCDLGVEGLCPSATGVRKIRMEKKAKMEVKVEDEEGEQTVAEQDTVKTEVAEKREPEVKVEEDIEDLAPPTRARGRRK